MYGSCIVLSNAINVRHNHVLPPSGPFLYKRVCDPESNPYVTHAGRVPTQTWQLFKKKSPQNHFLRNVILLSPCSADTQKCGHFLPPTVLRTMRKFTWTERVLLNDSGSSLVSFLVKLSNRNFFRLQGFGHFHITITAEPQLLLSDPDI